MNLREIAAILVGGGVGSLCRFALSLWVQKRTQAEYFPWGIFTVNALGCLARRRQSVWARPH